LLVQAWCLLLGLDIALRILPFRKVRLWIKPAAQKDLPAAQVERLIHRTSQYVDLAARNHLYTMTCLRRSLALQWLLSKAGLATTLQFGVRRENGQMLAHAWLVYQDQVIDNTVIPIELYANLKAKEVA
jgi:hypothetical protein